MDKQMEVASTTADTPMPIEVSKSNPIVRFFASHPKGFWFIFWGEFAERSSYYGMRAILALYMADKLGLGEKNAATYLSFFMAACYFLPLLGGYVADNFIGKYWTIVGFSLPYILGHFILGFENYTALVIALVLLAMGSGVIKPNISTLMGLTYDQERPGQTKLRSDAFAIFYFSINVGAALSQFALPPIRTHYGYWVAFLVPAGLMVVAFAIFAAGKPYYAREQIGGVVYTPEQKKQRMAILGRIAGLFTLVMFFWAIFDQSASTWIFFADTYMDCRIFGLRADPDQIQTFNPVFILLLLPPITMLFHKFDAWGFHVRPTGKIIVGFLLTALCMGVMAFAASMAGPAVTEPRLVLKEGEIKLSEARVVFNNSDLKVRNVRATAKDGVFTLDGGSVVGPDGEIALKSAASLFPSGDAAFDDNGAVKIKKGKIFFSNGELSSASGTIQIKDGAIAKTTGSLKKGDDGVTDNDKPVVQMGNYVLIQNKVTVWWKVLAFLVITVAEVLISVTGLELGYTAAPKSMSGFVTACWLLTVGMANLAINAPVTRLYKTMPPATYFTLLAVTLLVVTVAFFFVAKQFNRVTAAAAEGNAS
jgi:POT family proton-dependent oligopeptide transporter